MLLPNKWFVKRCSEAAEWWLAHEKSPIEWPLWAFVYFSGTNGISENEPTGWTYKPLSSGGWVEISKEQFIEMVYQPWKMSLSSTTFSPAEAGNA